MERAAWTDERLEDFRGYVERRFDQVDGRLDRMDADIREMRGEIAALRTTMLRIGAAFTGTMMLGFLALVGAVLQVS